MLSFEFIEHPSFSKEIKKFSKKHPATIDFFQKAKKLLSLQFNPTKPQSVISTEALKRMNKIGPNIHVFKLKMAVGGLRFGQRPRVGFWLQRPSCIIFLVFQSYNARYSGRKFRKIIKMRIRDFDPGIKFERY